jgi:hypothetical protein
MKFAVADEHGSYTDAWFTKIHGNSVYAGMALGMWSERVKLSFHGKKDGRLENRVQFKDPNAVFRGRKRVLWSWCRDETLGKFPYAVSKVCELVFPTSGPPGPAPAPEITWLSPAASLGHARFVHMWFSSHPWPALQAALPGHEFIDYGLLSSGEGFALTTSIGDFEMPLGMEFDVQPSSNGPLVDFLLTNTPSDGGYLQIVHVRK